MSEHVDTPLAAERTVAAPGLDAATATALLQHSACAIALCDAQGRIDWCNRVLLDLCGGAPADGRGQPLGLLLALNEADTRSLDDALRQGRIGPLADMRVGGNAGGWWRAHLGVLPDGRRATHWSLVDELHRQSAEAQRLAELLDLTQDFGRLAVWERDPRSLNGRWDRHMYRFWGLSEGDGTPDLERAAESILAADRARVNQAFRHSMRRVGTYSHRYRVRAADGVVRQLHSQWVVKPGPDGLPERVLGILVDDTEAWQLAHSHAETAEQLELALDLANIVIFRHDLRSDWVTLGNNAFNLLGLPAPGGDLHADELRALVHPDDQAALRTAMERAVATGVPVNQETRFRHGDGSWRHVLTRRILQRDASGQPTALLGVGLDLSERVESSKRKTELMRQFELTTRAAGIGYWSVEADSRKPRWSEQTFALHGLPPDAEALPMKQWLQRFVHPADRDAVQQRYFDWVQRGGPTLVQELRIVREDGSTHHVQSWSRLEGRPGHYDIYGVLMDVTERRAAEAALRQASERAALATRGAGMGTWEQDLQTGQVYWDEQMWRLRGLAPRPQPPSAEERMALVHPEDRAATARILNKGESDGGLANLEFRVRWPDGQWRLIASRAIGVPDVHGKLTRRIGVNWDITDTRNTRLAQRESQAKSQFMSRMSHELRTPLNAVLGFAQLLMADGERVSPETRRRRLEQILGAGQHLLSLIDDVLDISSLQGGEIRIRTQAVPLPALVAETLPLVHRQARQRKVKLRSGALAGVARADATRLRQVLLNLLTNAVKYNRDGGRVLVEAEALDGAVCLRVSDTGRGMSAAQLQQAFEPFNRLGLESEAIEGTGMGLAIVKALVERMGGTVQARSTPDEGSVFEVQLPDGSDMDADASDLPLQDAVAGPSTWSGVQAGQLLYIEDNPVNLMIVQELLAQRPDLRLHTAVNGLSGLDMAQRHRPDLILVDMQLPDIDGHEVLRRLRANQTTADIRCISLSANAMPDDIARALQAGFDDYWTKPLDLRVFMRSLDSIFGSADSVR